MPKKPQVAREEILRTALELVRSGGDGVLNARALAKALGCSTQPIFRNFTDMQALRAALLEEIHNRYLAFMEAYIAASAHPPYKASGLAYIAFARTEPRLFRQLFMRERSSDREGPELADWEPTIAAVQGYTGLSHREAELFHLELWGLVHGTAVMLATGYLDLDEETISGMLTDVYQGLKLKWGKENERDRDESADQAI